MKAYKVEILIIDFDEIGEQSIKDVLVKQKYPNYCINPIVMKMTGVDVGDWNDSHPLNNMATVENEYLRLFTQ